MGIFAIAHEDYVSGTEKGSKCKGTQCIDGVPTKGEIEVDPINA